MFDQLELIKGHTPDKGADSLGATINLKTRSPLSMREKRRINYNFGVRTAPSFTEQVPLREAHRSHPIFNVSWQEVFGVLGGDRNLGVSLNVFYSENAVGGFRTIRDFQDTPNSPAYLWITARGNNYNNRKQGSINLKTDYRLSPNTKLSFNTVISDAIEGFRNNTRREPSSAIRAPCPAPPAASFPASPIALRGCGRRGDRFDDQHDDDGAGTFYNRLRRFDLGAEHTWGPFEIDYKRDLPRRRTSTVEAAVAAAS